MRHALQPNKFRATVTWSNYTRFCAKCRKTLGRNGKSYDYGRIYQDERVTRQVCPPCHQRIQRRSLKAWRISQGFQ